MRRIGILSDTHGAIDEGLWDFFSCCDELWHAGDIGTISVADSLADFKPLRAVYGNIDDQSVRIAFPGLLYFTVEQVRVLMLHIGGRPENYTREVRDFLLSNSVDLLVCGHSHILQVKYDRCRDMLFINPGASGNSGFHKVKTAVRLTIEGNAFRDLEVWEKERG